MNATINTSRKDKSPRTLFSVSLWVIPLIMLPLFLLTTCTQLFLKLDNPTDPNSSNYQGYTTVTMSSAIEPGSPSDGGTLTSSTLTISKVTNALAYELVLATSSAALTTNSIFDKDNYNSNVMDISTAPLADTTIYYWHARTKDSTGIWGEWSNSFSFTKIVVITTVAGNGTSGFSGDDGAATSAELQNPHGVALDASGNLYIADYENNCIRKVNVSTGIITTVAGNGTSGGYRGDGGAATSAWLYHPDGIALDASGNLYIADYGNNCIRKVTASTGIITMVAGKYATYGHGGDGGAAISAELYYPMGIALDASGNLYIADYGNNCIRKVTVSTGIITTVAGNGTSGYSGDGGAATAAKLKAPLGVALDASGNLYIADYVNNCIRKVTVSTGIITTVAGNGTSGYSGDGGAATSAELYYPRGVALDASGNLYIADIVNNRIRKVNASTGIITTAAGSGTSGYSGDGRAATAAKLKDPLGVALDASGNLYIADSGNSCIRKVH